MMYQLYLHVVISLCWIPCRLVWSYYYGMKVSPSPFLTLLIVLTMISSSRLGQSDTGCWRQAWTVEPTSKVWTYLFVVKHWHCADIFSPLRYTRSFSFSSCLCKNYKTHVDREIYTCFVCFLSGRECGIQWYDFGPRTLSGAFAENERTRRIKIKIEERKCHKLNMIRLEGLEHPSAMSTLVLGLSRQSLNFLLVQRLWFPGKM